MADDDDDDFQNPSDCAFLPLSQPTSTRSPPPSLKLSSKSRPPLKPSNSQTLLLRPSKRFKRSPNPGKENLSLPSPPSLPPFHRLQNNGALDEPSPSSSLSWNLPVDSDADRVCSSITEESGAASVRASLDDECGGKLDKDESCGHFRVRVSRSIESRLLGSRLDRQPTSPGDGDSADDESEDFEPGTQLDMLLDLCCNGSQQDVPTGMEFGRPDEDNSSGVVVVHCPLCGVDISDLNDEQRQVHTNDCLDKEESPNVVVPPVDRGQVVDGTSAQSSGQVVNAFPVVEWLRGLGLGKYDEIFTREEIDWDTLKWLTEEDLFSIGVTALGPRKKIAHALEEFGQGSSHTVDMVDTSEVKVDGTSKAAANKLITDFFAGSVANRNNRSVTPNMKCGKKNYSCSGRKQAANPIKKGKLKDIPVWCCIPGTPFRVDAFRFLRRDCSHWFLTHFHLDHYQGLTRSFCHGMIYCSLITARLVNMKLGIPWEKLHVLPLNQKITVAGVDMTCMDANHCPGSIIILFEPPDGKAVLHTGDFRFSEEMTGIPALRNHPIHTLILDTTYCNPQFDFPKQEAVIQFVIEAIQAEAFNPKTLFLIGSYTIGKERLFLEVGRVLRQKVYVTLAKMRLLQCLELPDEDMKWLTLNEHESHIHVVPMWTLASFKRLKHTANQYANRFSLIVAFSPSGWTFGKGKKKSPGRRWQQGTIIRYEVPYSEHCSFTELKEFVKVISPARIIPSVNNGGPESSNAMVDLLS